MHNLNKEILTQPKKTVMWPSISNKKTNFADFDLRITRGEIKNYFDEIGTHVKSASPRSQNENGLVERNWHTLICTEISWMTASILPSEFCFHAIKRAYEISN